MPRKTVPLTEFDHKRRIAMLQLRQKLGMTQEEFGKLIGMTKHSVANRELAVLRWRNVRDTLLLIKERLELKHKRENQILLEFLTLS